MSTRRDKETLTLRERETPFPPPLSHHSPPIPLVSSSNLQISWSHSNCTTSSPWEFSSILGCIYGIQLNSSPGIQWVSLKHHLLKSCKVQLSSVRRNPAQTIYYCTQNWITAASENFLLLCRHSRNQLHPCRVQKEARLSTTTTITYCNSS